MSTLSFMFHSVLCDSVQGSRFGSRNLEEGGCSLHRYRRQKPGGTEGANLNLHIHSWHSVQFIHIVHSGFSILCPGLQARGGSL